MIGFIEAQIARLLLVFFSVEQINGVLGDPQTVAIMVGVLLSISTASLGVFLVLRKNVLTSDAISHTVLLGIAVMFLILVFFTGEGDLNSPWLLLGAAAAGLLTVVLTEFVSSSQLVKADAALGLVFPLLFAIAVILISRFADNAHLDVDAVLVGEIGLAYADTRSYCFDRCDDVVITPDDPQAETGQRCTNCSRGGISPRDPEAIFEQYCTNCGTYSASEAWRERLIPEAPELVFMPKSLSVMALVTLLNIGFVGLFYKELKLGSFDPALAQALGFRPGALSYGLMALVSLTAVAAFDAVGSILVIAFFAIPAASAYLLTDRLWQMLIIAPIYGAAGVVAGYEFSRGSFFGLPVEGFLAWLDATVGLGGFTSWNVSISASMALMVFVLFVATWIVSPRYGLVSTLLRRANRQQRFHDQMLITHLYNHLGTEHEERESRIETLHEHLGWSAPMVQASLARLRVRGWVRVDQGIAHITDEGQRQVEQFNREVLHRGTLNEQITLSASGD